MTWKLRGPMGIPIRLHWSVLMFYPVSLAGAGTDWVGGILTFLGLLLLILIHEYGHAVIAKVKRLDVWEIRVHFPFGLCIHDDPASEQDEIAVAWGGLLAQAAVFGLFWSLSAGIHFLGGGIPDVLHPLLHVFLGYNLVIAAINLLPVAPLDGAMIWKRLPIGFDGD